jgi:hypothetical protein
MAIIYSYPETTELLPTDLLIGTSTLRVAGKKKNITKNFTLELLKNFILDGNTGVQWGTITGLLSNQTDLQNALNAKQNNITLTTTGSSGPATLVGATLNIPQYSGLSYTFTSPLVDTAGVVTINQSNATTDGYLSAANWVTFNSKQDALSGNGFVKISGTTISYDNSTYYLASNPSNFITSAALTPYLLSTVAASTYYPIPTGTISQYIRGDGTLATFPTSSIPTLDQVLTAGNTSILAAKIGVLYGYDNVNSDYGTLEFYDSGIVIKAATTNHFLFYNDDSGTVQFSNGTYKPTLNFAGVGNNIYTFQNVNGTLAFLSDIPSLTGYVPTSRALTINGTNYDLTADRSWSVGTVTSVGLSMPSAFTVSSSPVTGSGTIAVTGAGVSSQYVRGDGTLANFPTSTGGGASVSYYLNGSVSQGTIGGVAYKEMNSVPVIGAGTDFTINADGYIAQFITDVGDPNKLLIPAGNWNFETYFSASSAGGSPRFYIELYKYDGTTFTLIATNSATPEYITGGTSIDLYFTALAVPTTALTVTDRLAVRFYVIHSGRTITMHTEDNHLSQIITTFSSGLTALNGLTAQVQYFAIGTSGTDFNISSATDTHTFNLPTASATNRGALSSTDWTTFNSKQNTITLTTTGSSGSSTFISNTLNVPTYTLSGLGGQPLATNLTSLSGLTYASTSFVKMTAAGTFALDTNTYLTGNQSITLSGDISGTGTTTITTAIGTNKVTNAMLAQVSTATIHGRATAGTGNVENLTGTQVTSLLDTFSSTLKGLAPASGGGTTNFLRADGTWAAAGGGGSTPVKLTSQTLTAASWTLVGGYYTYAFSNVNVTTTCDVSVTPQNASYLTAYNAQVLPFVGVAAGVATFYSQFPPQANVVVDIVITQTT